MSMLQEIRRIVGYSLPYVYVESFRISNTNILHGDVTGEVDTSPEFVRNKFGTNKIKKKNQQNASEYKTDNVFEVRVKLKVPELLNQRRWYQLSETGLDIQIIQSSHPELTELILRQDRIQEELIPTELKTFLNTKKVTIAPNLDLRSYASKEIGDDVLCMIPIDTIFKANSNHLSYFVYSQMGDRVGTKTVERIIDGGRYNSTSVSYYLPNGDVWAGPVHFHEGTGWMAGPRHTRRAHAVLERVEHNNVKIQDFRIFNALQQEQNKVSLSREVQERRVFSDLFLARDDTSAARGLFVLDPLRLLATKSRFNSLLFTSNKRKLLSRCSIQSLKIIRSKIEKGNVNDFGQLDQSRNYELVSESSDGNRGFLRKQDYFVDSNNDGVAEDYIGTVTEKRLGGLEHKRSFSFYDHKIRTFEEGKYRYGLELTITDPTIPYLRLQVQGLRKALHILEEYYGLLNNKQFLSLDGGLRENAIDLVSNLYGSRKKVEKNTNFAEFPWRRAVKIYISVLRELTGVSMGRYARNLYSLLGPTSRDLSGVENFIKLIESFIQRLQSLIAETAYSDKRSRAKSNSSLDVTTVKVMHFFDSEFDTGLVKGYGLNYHGNSLIKNYNGPLSMTLSSILDRFKIEAEKRETAIPPTSNTEEYAKFYSKISPFRLNTGGTSYNLSDKQSEDYRRARIHILRLKSEQDDNSVRTPVPDMDSRAMLESLISSSSVSVGKRRRRRRNPCDPSRVVPEEHERLINSEELFPNREADNFVSIFNSKDSEQDTKLDEPLDESALENVLGLGESDVFAVKEANLRYVLSFDDDLNPVTVQAPFNSAEPYLVLLGSASQEAEKDSLNEIIILENSKEEPKPEPTQLVEDQVVPTVETEEPKEEEYIEDFSDTTVTVKDNAEGAADSIYNTGAQEVASRTVSVSRENRAAPVQRRESVATEVRVENQQAYLSGLTARGATSSGGNTSGY